MSDAVLLEVEGLVAGYGAADVLQGINVAVAAGEMVAVLGSNGAGKTTLNNVLSGILRPRAGSIRFDGHLLGRAAPAEIVERGLVHVPEGRRIFPDLSVEENLVLGSYRRGKANRARNRERVMSIFPRLAERSRQRAGTLSGGEQQMLAIGRGLMAEPRFLILDEPSLGLSPLLVEEMFTLIQRLGGEGLTILLVEQNVVQSLAIAAHAHVLENGRVVLSGKGEELMGDPRLQKTYLGM
ncbi:MAG: ABC transporter ATP-binding protein [Hyphomicrobiales bacterium]|nr:ABC transporter ATP-binding protein [Hyphomicrobiales bacterium]